VCVYYVFWYLYNFSGILNMSKKKEALKSNVPDVLVKNLVPATIVANLIAYLINTYTESKVGIVEANGFVSIMIIFVNLAIVRVKELRK